MFLYEGRGVKLNARLQAFSRRSGVYLSAVRADTVSFKEYLNGASRHTDIDFSLDVFVGNGVIHFIHGDVVIRRDCGNFPC